MKRKRTNIFIAISSIALAIVLIIQVNWIVETARIKEELFNEKANMVLTRTSEALAKDTLTCRNMQYGVEKNDITKIDSLFNYYMNFYSFHIDYSFEVLIPTPPFDRPIPFAPTEPEEIKNTLPPPGPQCYGENLKEVSNRNGFELKLNFPGKEEYIMAQMGVPFITSVLLILIVLGLFWRTTVSLMKEKEISEHTTDFLNNMTHEFKTPLTNIALAGRMISKDMQLKEDNKIRHYSEIILTENEKLRLQVEQVLSMTALERGEIPLQKTETDMHQLIRETGKCMGLQIDNKEGILALSLDADRFVVMGDKSHLLNTLCNLIDNGIKYSPGKPLLSIQTANRDHLLIITVSDKGIGIEKEYQKKVFDKFFRVPTGNVHDVKGFGLGLAYIKKIIELHGGTIELKSEGIPGQSAGIAAKPGTTFIITLPYA